ncbi:hypothetical protein B6U84_05395 [Candidatus Bathyarchaeota archaeon ex4484_40]|nr:MAG: hypothetical protein B6U84_05395 [Candidatus Bathyarchaeota archaeon ex4484_40]
MKRRRLLGLAITALGLMLIFNIVNLSAFLMFVSYVDIWDYLYPGGMDSNSPDIVTAGSTITLTARLKFRDESVDWYSDPNGWTVYVEISKNGTAVTTLTLQLQNVDDASGIAEWTYPWNVPSDEDVLYTLVWHVDTPDSGSDSKTTYAKTPLIEPDGVFKVNGIDASADTTITLISPTLSLEFTPSRAADKITAVKVEVWKDGSLQDTVALTEQADAYTGTYTLPSAGTYELKGYVEWTGGNPLRKMSLLATYGEGSASSGGEPGSPAGWLGLNLAESCKRTVFSAGFGL